MSSFKFSEPKERIVPAFTIQAQQKNVKLKPPPHSGATLPRPLKPTLFRKCYDRGDFPLLLGEKFGLRTVVWRSDLDKVDLIRVLPLFFEGLRESEFPYEYLANQGIHDMLQVCGNKILPVIPHLILPLKAALNTRHPRIICKTLKVLQHLVMSADAVGEALVPYYRQLLPILNMFKDKRISTGELIDYGQRKKENLADLILETLELLERRGGDDAYINIKYLVPTYESCVYS